MIFSDSNIKIKSYFMLSIIHVQNIFYDASHQNVYMSDIHPIEIKNSNVDDMKTQLNNFPPDINSNVALEHSE